MAPNEALTRLKKNQVEQHLRTVEQIQKTISDFQHLSDILDHEIKAEENRSKIHEPSHFVYPTFARAIVQRRNNLMRSIDGLKSQLDTVKKVLREENEYLATVEGLASVEEVNVRLQPFHYKAD